MLVKAKRLQQRRLAVASAGAAGAEAVARAEAALHGSLSYAAVAANALGSPHFGILVKAATTASSLG